MTAPEGYLPATSRDALGRKQYRWGPAWRSARDIDAFRDPLASGETLPARPVRVDDDLRRPGMPREKVLALAVRLLDVT